MLTTKAWVIEAWSGGSYWSGRVVRYGSPEMCGVEDAIRFARREDAERAARHLAPGERGSVVLVVEHEFTVEGEEEDAAIKTARLAALEVGRLRMENEALRELIPLVDGLMMYEDKAIEAFAERRDPCPTVMTGPRKWLRRLRQTRASLKTLLKETGG